MSLQFCSYPSCRQVATHTCRCRNLSLNFCLVHKRDHVQSYPSIVHNMNTYTMSLSEEEVLNLNTVYISLRDRYTYSLESKVRQLEGELKQISMAYAEKLKELKETSKNLRTVYEALETDLSEAIQRRQISCDSNIDFLSILFNAKASPRNLLTMNDIEQALLQCGFAPQLSLEAPKTYFSTYIENDTQLKVYHHDSSAVSLQNPMFRATSAYANYGDSAILIAGGVPLDVYGRQAFLLYPASSGVQRLASMNYPRSYFALALFRGHPLAIGGAITSLRQSTSSVECYYNDSWNTFPELCVPRVGHSACSIGEDVYVAGGFNSPNFLDTIEKFNTQEERWGLLGAKLCNPCTHPGLFACSRNIVLIIGGNHGVDQSNVWRNYKDIWLFHTENENMLYWGKTNEAFCFKQNMWITSDVLTSAGFNGTDAGVARFPISSFNLIDRR